MEHISLNVSKDLCAGCSMALRRFIGKMDGVEEIGVGDGWVEVTFDEHRIEEGFLRKITNESLDKLGYSQRTEGT